MSGLEISVELQRDAATSLVREANKDRDIELLGLIAAWFVMSAPLPVIAQFLEWLETDEERAGGASE